MAFLAFFYAILAPCKKYTFCKGRGRIQKHVLFKGYNRLLKKWIEMKILDDGTVLADDWEHIEEDSIKRYTEQMDMGKKMLWEDDQIVDMQTGKCMIIRFGEYETYCVEEEQVMKSVGFYLETRNGENLPLGNLSEYANKIEEPIW